MDTVGPMVEQTTGEVTFWLVDVDGSTKIPKSAVTTLTLGIYASDGVTPVRVTASILDKMATDGTVTLPVETTDTEVADGVTRDERIAVVAATGPRSGGGNWTTRYRFKITIDGWEVLA